MASLIYFIHMSLDGFVADEKGIFEWTAPDEEVFTFVNNLLRPVGIYLFGRRMYEVMAVWDTLDLRDQPQNMREFAGLWQAADKVVYSSTLEAAITVRTRVERRFEPEAIWKMKADSQRDLNIGGPTLAAYAIRAGLVDLIHIIIVPIIVGGGTRAFSSGISKQLILQEQHRFRNGMVYLQYRSVNGAAT